MNPPVVQEQAKHQTTYRPEIDGLRAIAVLSVLAFHAFPNWIRGGFAGVDIFFVISGFLISGIIYGEIDTGHFSFGRFYAQRIKRIFPALIVVLVATWIAGKVFFLPGELVDLEKNIVAGAAFVSNLFLDTQSGYFDGSSSLNPLLHLWSLGIEEQFYILWPILLVLTWRQRHLLWMLCALMGLSFLANLALVQPYPVETFYLPFTRFWELWAGAALAYRQWRRKAAVTSLADASAATAEARWSWLVTCMPLAGLILFAAGILLFKGTDLFPGWRALLPVTGAVVLLTARPENLVNRLILCNPVALFVGRISYPLYLWHWPILAYLRLQFDHTQVPIL